MADVSIWEVQLSFERSWQSCKFDELSLFAAEKSREKWEDLQITK